MQFTSPIAFIAAAFVAHSAAVAIPAEAPIPITGYSLVSPALTPSSGEESGLHARQETQFLTCRDSSFANCITWTGVTTGVCYNIRSDWNDAATSVRAFDGFQCLIWKDFNCRGSQGGPVTSDNRHRDLTQFGWNDQLSSWKCFTN